MSTLYTILTFIVAILAIVFFSIVFSGLVLFVVTKISDWFEK